LVYAVLRVVWGLRVEGLENVPRTGGLLVTCNHVANLDPPVVGCVVPREAGFVAKKELFRVPGLGALIRTLNAVPLDRTRLSMEAIDRFGRMMTERRMALVFFPEGTRSRTGRLGKAKVGVGVLLARFPVPIVPVSVEGTDTLFRSLFRRGRMRVVFGRPYTLPKGEGPGAGGREEARRLADAVLERIRRLQQESATSEREAGQPVSDARDHSVPPGPAGDARISREGMVPNT
jgi:1-acyl-sn-glycerol-3-phosphate acyltransferase